MCAPDRVIYYTHEQFVRYRVTEILSYIITIIVFIILGLKLAVAVSDTVVELCVS